MIRQIAARVHAALGRWLAEGAPPIARKRTSWFGCDQETLHAALPRDADEEEAEVWWREHFRNWPVQR